MYIFICMYSYQLGCLVPGKFKKASIARAQEGISSKGNIIDIFHIYIYLYTYIMPYFLFLHMHRYALCNYASVTHL